MPGSKNQRCSHAGGSPHAGSIITHKHGMTSEHLRPLQCCHAISKCHRAQNAKVTNPINLRVMKIKLPLASQHDQIGYCFSSPGHVTQVIAPLCHVARSDSMLHRAVFIFPFHVCILYLHQLIWGMRKHYSELTLLSNYLACVRNL